MRRPKLTRCRCQRSGSAPPKAHLHNPRRGTKHAADDDEDDLVLLEDGVEQVLELDGRERAQAIAEGGLYAEPLADVSVRRVADGLARDIAQTVGGGAHNL